MGAGLLRPRAYQVEAVEAAEAAWARGMKRPAEVLFTGAGKGHPVDTDVPTPGGIRRWGDLVVGDEIYGADGQPTAVTAIFDRGSLPTFEVTLSDESSVQVDGEHLWAVRTKFDKRAGIGYRTMSTLEVAGRTDFDWFIPMTAPTVGLDSSLPIDPYLLGVLLGDGGLSVEGRVLVTCRNDTAELARAVLPSGVTMTHTADAGQDAQTWILGSGVGRSDNPVMTALRGMGLMGATAWHKFIPEEYRATSVQQRLAILQGLCDTDGHVPRGATAVEYTTVSERLACDVAELVNSLGGRAKVTHKRTTWVYLGERRYSTAYRMHIRLPPGLCPVRVPRKVEALATAVKYGLTRRIVSVKRVADAEIRCITVAAEDHLYLITRDHIVTHNTVIFALVGTRRLEREPDRRVLVIVHTEELLDQAIRRWHSVAPGIRVGAVQAQRNETLPRVIVATVQTLRSEARRAMLRNVGLVIVDECHHSVATSYRTVMNWFGCFGGVNRSGGAAADAIGYTATMMRADQLALGDVWQDVVYSRSIADGIGDGSLVRPRGVHVQVDDLDLSKVRMSGGDYRKEDLGEAIESSLAPEAIAKAVAEHAPRRKIMVFAPTVGSASMIGDALSASGRRVGLVHGELPKPERRAVLDAFRADPEGIVTNCQVLTEGFDEPAADCAVIARPTRSPGLYIQIAGRVLRPYPGKADALLLDVVGATKIHSLVSGISLFGEEPKPKAERDPLDPMDWEDPDELAEGQQDARSVLGAVVDGPLVSTEVDLFAGSTMQWHRTRAGVFFLEAGERYIAIVPGAAGGYDVTAMHKTRLHTGQWVVQGIEDMSYAMAWADGEVTSSERTTAAKGRSWRATPPSEKMKALATRLQLSVTEGMRQGEVSNMISVALASKRIDSCLPGYMRGAR